MLYFHAILLIVCIQTNIRTNSHWPAVLIFVSLDFLVHLAIGLSLGLSVVAILIASVINFAFAYLYFFLLRRSQGSSHYWTIMALGIALFLGIRFIR